jgi:hypothetical protein
MKANLTRQGRADWGEWEVGLLEVCSDVVIRFTGHGSDKGQAGALKALARRRTSTRGPAWWTSTGSSPGRLPRRRNGFWGG